MSDLEVRAVPKDLYYHEVAYVRGLERQRDALVAALEEVVSARDLYELERAKAGARILLAKCEAQP